MSSILESKNVFVFDWDGTILDSMSIKFKNFAFVLHKKIKEFDNKSISEDKIKACYTELSGIQRNEIVKEICSRNNVNYTDLLFSDFTQELSNINKIELAKSIVFEDAINFLEKLKNESKSIYVSSSSPSEELLSVVSQKLPKNISSYISEIYGSEGDFKKGKGHFDAIIKNENTSKSNLIFFGDDIIDYELGKEYGIDTYLIDRSNKYSHRIQKINSFRHIYE